MKYMLQSKIGRLRIIGFLEGISLLILIFIAMPLKYGFDSPFLTKIIGPMHGALFLLFVFNSLSVGIEQHWKVKSTFGKVFIASMIPFGTFYIDKKFLSKL